MKSINPLGSVVSLLLLIFFCIILIGPDARRLRTPLAAAPPGGDIEPYPFISPQELLNAEAACNDSNYDSCGKELNQIITNNPGTALAAEAALWEVEHPVLLAPGQQQQLLQQMAAQYAGTRYEIIAKQLLAENQFRGDNTASMQAMSDLINEFGGVPVEKVMQVGGTGEFRRQVLYMSLAAKHGLPDVYSACADGLRYENKFKEAFNIYHFVREEFPEADLEEANRLVLPIVVTEMRAGTELTTIPGGGEGPPSINPIASHDGETIGETQPKIEVELSDGDINHSQVDLSKLVWTLDGQDITNQMEVGSQIDPSGQPGPTFEHLFLTFVPVDPLPPGTHTVAIRVQNYAGFSASTQWSFTVK